MPNASESFRTLRNPSERTENHTLTVREATRMFEVAGVARTERSIINWCQPNPQGVARLDAFYDPNDRRWFITPQSVERAIQEERAKAATNHELEPAVPQTSEPARTVSDMESAPSEVRTLRQEVMDLKITNRGKDYFIEQLQKEREGFADERREYVEKLMTSNRKMGELETRLLQLEAPAHARQEFKTSTEPETPEGGTNSKPDITEGL